MKISASHSVYRRITLALLTAGVVFMTNDAFAQSGDTIRIGTMFVTEGALASLGQEANRGLEIALAEFNGTIAGKRSLFSRKVRTLLLILPSRKRAS